MRIATLVLAALLSLAPRAGADVLLIPDSGNDRVWAFDPFDGSLIQTDWIPNHPSLAQPIHAIESGRGTLLVSDELNDTVLEFGYNGAFIGTFADAADGIDGPFGIAAFGGKVFVCSNVNARIVRFDQDGSNPVVWSSGWGTPRDILFRAGDALVSESAGDDIVSLSHAGAFNGIWHASDGASGIDFPQQLFEEAGGQVLAAGFSPPFGIYRYLANGTLDFGYTNLITSPRGVVRLGNGNILYAGGTRIMSYDPVNLNETTILNQIGASFRFIERVAVGGPVPVEPSSWGRIKSLYR
jgi:hypothetical protein